MDLNLKGFGITYKDYKTILYFLTKRLRLEKGISSRFKLRSVGIILSHYKNAKYDFFRLHNRNFVSNLELLLNNFRLYQIRELERDVICNENFFDFPQDISDFLLYYLLEK